MMANRIRGEVEITLGDAEFTLCLTLGALAEIESGLGVSNLHEMEQRLGRPSTGDLMLILCALLRGGGHDMTREELGAMPINIREVVRAIESAFRLAMAVGAGDSETSPGKS